MFLKNFLYLPLFKEIKFVPLNSSSFHFFGKEDEINYGDKRLEVIKMTMMK